MRSKCGEFLELFAVSRDNNLYVVGDISKKCLDTTETNNYQNVISKNKTLFLG